MGLWVSKHIVGPHVPPLEEEIVVRPLWFKPEEELEQHTSVETTAADTVTVPIPLYHANAFEEVSDNGSPALEGQSSQQHKMSNHSAEISSSHLTMDMVNIQQGHEEPRNDSRHPQSSLENERKERECRTGRKFAYWSGSVSFTGAIGIIGARAGNLTVNIKMLPFYTCSTCMGSAFIISMLLLILTTVCPAPKISARIIKFTQFIILALFILAISFGLAIVF